MDGQQWDRDILVDLFNYRDQQCISNTPFGGNDEEDKLYWREDITGEYTCLPIRTNLYAKRVPVPLICPMCNMEDETVNHVLVNCTFANQCWERRCLYYRASNISSFDLWLMSILDRTSKDGHGEIVTMCGSIWQARNQLVWNNKKSEVNSVVFSTKQYLAEWKMAQGSSTKALYRDVIPGDGASSWVKPKENTVKVSVDAVLFTELSKYGIGLLARDDSGQVIQGRSEVYDGSVRPEIAEAIAVKEALSWIQVRGWKEVVVETDYLMVVQAIRSKVNMKSPFGSIILEYRRMIMGLNIELFFVK
ncbi:uncharacterized protein LOC141695501 [Apium graveolens]|uniref:uncharacterized protein LOC141695501 n=1 Tax=Apium graveolens TaxID=4045 RepID=UPI003D7BFD65